MRALFAKFILRTPLDIVFIRLLSRKPLSSILEYAFSVFHGAHILQSIQYKAIFSCLYMGAAFLVLGHFLSASVGNTMLLGASAGIISVFAFIATVTPSYGVYIFTLRVKVLYLLGAIILFDLFDFSANSGGKIAHLGGIIAGIMVGVMAKYQLWSRKRMRVEMPEMKPNKPERQKVKQHRINQLLDKINASGYASLTDKEKKFLFEASKENDM